MENPKNTSTDFDKKQREYVWSYFREKELIHFEDIFIDASKAFVINSALRWAIKEIKENNMREPRWKKFKRMIDQYVAGMVDIKWSSGKPISIEVKYDRS